MQRTAFTAVLFYQVRPGIPPVHSPESSTRTIKQLATFLPVCYTTPMKYRFCILCALIVAVCISVYSCASVPEDIPAGLTAEELVQLAQTSYDKGNVAAAEAYYEAILVRYHDDINAVIEAEYEIAHLKIKREKWQEAIPDLQRILSYYDLDVSGTLPPEYRKLAEIDLAKVPEHELEKAAADSVQ